MRNRLRSLALVGTLAFGTGSGVGYVSALDPHPELGALRYQASVVDGRQLLALDPSGDGRVVEAFGELDKAKRIAVLVPGCGPSLADFTNSPSTASPRRNAKALLAELRRTAPNVPTAVVAWVGYDTPEVINLSAVRSERAELGARDLVRLTKILPAKADVSLICHSYGSVTCGLAAKAAKAENLIAIGSPGMDAPSAAALETSARVWAARTADDPIQFVPNVRVLGLGHGPSPTSPEFGARVFSTGTITGHGSYYQPGSESLANMARIVLGRYADVTLASSKGETHG
ncbi:alpha/beta hydrolase [Tenggerimyces flavus]|uniref:Alpha/beta hydrolase n=1 Tax=Tenggerimyces flavus TaxID=1708749 RepID=A0ABV7YPB7_9ACTN|nr:alpha/beta hydrolase [Tenggerimyces flavus]MBM7786356.1 hypothetical protein [Tenggerimyces flavus]